MGNQRPFGRTFPIQRYAWLLRQRSYLLLRTAKRGNEVVCSRRQSTAEGGHQHGQQHEIGDCQARPSVHKLSDQPGRQRREASKVLVPFVRSSLEQATTRYSSTRSYTRLAKKGQHPVHCSNIGSFTSASTTEPIARRRPMPGTSA